MGKSLSAASVIQEQQRDPARLAQSERDETKEQVNWNSPKIKFYKIKIMAEGIHLFSLDCEMPHVGEMNFPTQYTRAEEPRSPGTH